MKKLKFKTNKTKKSSFKFANFVSSKAFKISALVVVLLAAFAIVNATTWKFGQESNAASSLQMLSLSVFADNKVASTTVPWFIGATAEGRNLGKGGDANLKFEIAFGEATATGSCKKILYRSGWQKYGYSSSSGAIKRYLYWSYPGVTKGKTYVVSFRMRNTDPKTGKYIYSSGTKFCNDANSHWFTPKKIKV